jgi:hypothetical protein
VLGLLVFACSDEPETERGSGGAAGKGGSVGAGVAGAMSLAGSAGNPAGGRAGSSNGGQAGRNANAGDASTGGAGRSGGGGFPGAGTANAGRAGSSALTPEQIRDATDAQCDPFCELLLSACPEIPEENCLAGCRGQAEALYEAGRCAAEFLAGYRCFNTEITATDIDCEGPTISGCLAEQIEYESCIAQGP